MTYYSTHSIRIRMLPKAKYSIRDASYSQLEISIRGFFFFFINICGTKLTNDVILYLLDYIDCKI